MTRLLFGLAAFLATSVAAASPADGLWLTQSNHGIVEVSDCDGGICGKLITSDRMKLNPVQTDAYNSDPGLRSRVLMGLFIFRGMKGGPQSWSGRLYNPADGKTYQGRVTMKTPDTLALRGCVIFPLCATQVWTRTH